MCTHPRPGPRPLPVLRLRCRPPLRAQLVLPPRPSHEGRWTAFLLPALVERKLIEGGMCDRCRRGWMTSPIATSARAREKPRQTFHLHPHRPGRTRARASRWVRAVGRPGSRASEESRRRVGMPRGTAARGGFSLKRVVAQGTWHGSLQGWFGVLAGKMCKAGVTVKSESRPRRQNEKQTPRF